MKVKYIDDGSIFLTQGEVYEVKEVDSVFEGADAPKMYEIITGEFTGFSFLKMNFQEVSQ